MNFNLKTTCLYPFVFSFLAFGQVKTETTLKRHNARNFTVDGKGWSEPANFYDRLPARAEKLVRSEVWKLTQNSAGISVRFITDADSISVRWKLRSPNLALPNMSAIAVKRHRFIRERKGQMAMGWRRQT